MNFKTTEDMLLSNKHLRLKNFPFFFISIFLIFSISCSEYFFCENCFHQTLKAIFLTISVYLKKLRHFYFKINNYVLIENLENTGDTFFCVKK